MRIWIASLALSLVAGAAAASVFEGPLSMRDPRWRIEAKEARVEAYRGREALALTDGIAWFPAGFRDGVVEFDLAIPDERGFHGLVFRAAGDDDYEHVYIRSHLSGKPDATQYTPVFNGVSGWQIYTGERYALPVSFDPGTWTHVRIAVEDRRMELTLDGRTLVFPRLEREPVPGAIGLSSSLATARFANLVITPGSPAWRGGAGASETAVPAGTVRRWRISSPFPEAALDPSRPFRRDEWSDLRWTPLDAGFGGIVNLAKAAGRTDARNTVFAAVTLRATRPTLLPLRFGFSDRVVVFLNGRPLFRGNDRYLSRDYRFLGSVGFYDEVVLSLGKGDHELWIAVSEDFGGWAVAAAISPESGVSVVGR